MAEHIEVARAFITIVPSLEGSQAEISKQLNAETEPAAKEAGEKSGKNFGESLAKGIKAAGAVIGAAFASATAATISVSKKFIEAAKSTAEMGDQIDKQSQKVGFSKKAWQEWDYVLKLAGSDMNTATAGIKTMTNQVDKAKNGNKEAIANFKALGISLKELKTLDRESIFEKVISGLQGMPESTKRAALANKILGRSGQELTPLFNQSAAATKNLIDQANKLGIIMDDKAVKASANFKDSLTTLKSTITGLKNALMSQFLPSLTTVTDGLAMVFGSKTDAERQAGIKTLEVGISNLANKLIEVAPTFFEAAGKIINALVSGIAPMLPSVVSALFNILSMAVQTVASMLPKLLPTIMEGIKGVVSILITVLPILIDGAMKLLTALAQWLGTPENARVIANGIVSMITSIAKTISETLPIILPAVVTLITEVAKCLTEEQNLKLILTAIWEIVKAIGIAIVKSIPIILSAIGQVIGNLFTAAVDGVAGILEKLVPIAADGIEGIVNFFKGIFGAIKDFFVNVGTAIKDFFVGIVNKIKEFFVGIGEKIKEAFTNIKNAVTGFFTNIKNAITSAFTNIKNAITSFFSNIKNAISGALNNIKGFFTNAFNGIKDAIAGIGEKIKGFFTGIIDFFKDLPKKALDLGKKLVEGIWNGIKNMGNWIKEKITGFGKGIVDGFKNIFKIKSPSRVMRDVIGKNLALGIGEGFENSMPGVVSDMKSSMASITDEMTGLTGEMSATVNANATATPLDGSQSVNGSPVTINVYGAEGQNINELANLIAVKLEDMTRRKEAVFA